ncbi:hypothetical protein QR680_018464 [Steinernema hermaphroditum]|uniref:Apple domain-containing protein n=1 Tax=Steinernema hermaphroditum TaxID=289476 RepID=A0AA39HIZ4_9BILA|nr:hypothetical protein QR680_018464 [Steinernema hermaphroditum]
MALFRGSIFLHAGLVLVLFACFSDAKLPCTRKWAPHDSCYQILSRESRTAYKMRGSFSQGIFKICNSCRDTICVQLGFASSADRELYPIENICLTNQTNKAIFFGNDGMSYASEITYEIRSDRILFNGTEEGLVSVVPLPVKLHKLSRNSGLLIIDYPHSCLNLDFEDMDDTLPLLVCKIKSSNPGKDRRTSNTFTVAFTTCLVFIMPVMLLWFMMAYFRWNEDLKLDTADLKTDKVPKFDVNKGKALLEADVLLQNKVLG